MQHSQATARQTGVIKALINSPAIRSELPTHAPSGIGRTYPEGMKGLSLGF